MSVVQIKTNKNLVRDTHSKAILNTDRNGLNEYYMKREIAKKQQEEQSETKMRLAQLEDDMKCIRKLLEEIAAIRNSNAN